MRRMGAALVALLVLTGCAREAADTVVERPRSAPSPAASGTSDAGSGLLDALADVSGEGPAAAYVEYGEPAWWRGLGVSGGSGDGRRWLPAAGSGLGSLAHAAAVLPKATGMTPEAGARAIAIGVPPRQAFRFDGGVDAGAVRAKLTALGAKPRRLGGHDGLSFTPGTEIDPSRTIVPGVTNQLNQVVVTDTMVATASAAGPLAAVMGGGPALAGSPDHAAVAACLGDVAAATIMASSAPGAVTLYGVGLRRPAGLDDRPVNVICVLPAASAATKVEQALTTQLTPAASTRNGGAYGDHAPEIAHDRVRADGRTVLRAVLTLNDTADVLFANRLLYQGELEALSDPSR
ncbi:hypothetical protein [Nonomuraea basaltis]|uniref:hypothetical protein n=1 Tax=Nonomuraea basaltis TaxID=2495887 RepID=UPI00110C5AED|nr:hypothetical protein [Nonomuraea basaltis]TMR89787.1 hypothetical protein EJK15_58910 [Nonomuraea basaltis]